MDSAHAYSVALMPRRHTVAGVVLVPFALGHALLLTRINNPLRAMWSGDEAALKSMEVGAGDLAWALWACSRPATRAMDAMSGWRMRWQIRRIAARVQAHGIMATMVGFSNYLAEGFTGPKLRKATSDAQPCGAPLIAMLKAGLVAHFGKTDEEALNTPMALALWDRAAYLEEQGLIKFWTQEDEEFMEWARELAADPERVAAMFEDRGERLGDRDEGLGARDEQDGRNQPNDLNAN